MSHVKKITIAIPTLNRAQYLKFTIDHFVSQILPYSEDVEIVVVNNASDDNTAIVMDEYVREYEFIKFIDCKDRLSLGDQFKRTVNFASAEYIILWGDDDIPAPFLIGYLLSLIEKTKCNLYYFNRLVGYEDGNSIKSLTVYDTLYSEGITTYESTSNFIEENFWGATFMSSVMFHKQIWNKGLDFDTNSHYGFEFMGVLYYGNEGRIIIRENYPLCIQRKVAFRAWGPDWPLYALLGLPNMAQDLENVGLFNNGLNVWRQKFNKFPIFCYTLMSAATDKKKYKPYCRQFAHFQTSIIRKYLIYIIIYLFPGWLYKLSRKILFQIKK